MAGGIYLEVDTSELNAEIERLRAILTPERFDQVMYGIFQRTGGHVRQILRKEIPKEYRVKAGEVAKTVGRPRLTGGIGGGTGCIIPLKGPRRSIGVGFSASGGARGWESKRKRYRVKANIVKSGQSVLPQTIGGMKPFRNLGPKLQGTGWYDHNKRQITGGIDIDGEWRRRPQSGLGKLTFVREGKSRLPIKKVSGIAIPQMPMNRSAGDVQRDIAAYLQERMQHEFMWLLASGK